MADNVDVPIPQDGWEPRESGITLRDYFAGQALATITGVTTNQVRDTDLMRLFGKERTNISGAEVAAALAYEIADAMVARRKATT